MNDNDRQVGLVSSGFVLVMFVIFLADKWLFVRPPTQSEQIGVAVGIVAGIIGCLYLRLTWDPHHLRPKDTKSNTATGCWFPIVTIGGAMVGGLTAVVFSVETNDFVGGCGTTALLICISYIMLQVWRHRPRASK
jgi:hypothetical protein